MSLKLIAITFILAASMMANPASAATNLDCMEAGYTAEQSKLFNDFTAHYQLGVKGGDDEAKKMIGPIAVHANECAAKLGWSTDAMLQSIYYKMSGLLGSALQNQSPLSLVDKAKVNGLLKGKWRDKLRAALGPIIEGQMGGGEATKPSKGAEMELGLIILAEGLPTEGKFPEHIGALLGALLMQEISAEKFAKL
jgi:hypothetical protein